MQTAQHNARGAGRDFYGKLGNDGGAGRNRPGGDSFTTGLLLNKLGGSSFCKEEGLVAGPAVIPQQ